MTDRPSHAQVRAHVLDLLDTHALPAPDRIVEDADEVVFLFEGPRVALIVELDDVPSDEEVRMALAGSPQR